MLPFKMVISNTCISDFWSCHLIANHCFFDFSFLRNFYTNWFIQECICITMVISVRVKRYWKFSLSSAGWKITTNAHLYIMSFLEKNKFKRFFYIFFFLCMQNKTLREIGAFLSDNLLNAIEISSLSEVRLFLTIAISKSM